MKKVYPLMVALFLVNGTMAQWFPQNSGTTNTLNSVYFTDANTGYAVGDVGVILKTDNGGINWESQNSGVTNNLHSVFFYDSNTGYAVGDSGRILKTTDGGLLWTIQFSGILKRMNSIYFTNMDTGYIACGQSDTSSCILKTINGGILWSVMYTYNPVGSYKITLKSIQFPETNIGYCVGYDFGGLSGSGHILKTINSGADWVVQYESGLLKSVYFLNPDTGYVVGAISPVKANAETWLEIHKTNDGGLNWAQYYSPNWLYLYDFESVYFTDANTGYTVGGFFDSEGTIFKTINGGTDWIIQDSAYSNYLMSVHFPAPDTGYIVGSNGSILKTTNGGGYPVGINNQNHVANTLNIYPNPSSTTITIESPAKGFLSIHNTSGQQLLQKEINEPKTTIDVSGWKCGVYLVKVAGEQGVSVGKFIKQ